MVYLILVKTKNQMSVLRTWKTLMSKSVTAAIFMVVLFVAMAVYFGRCIYALILNKTITEFLFGKYVT